MKQKITYGEAMEILLKETQPVETEALPLEKAYGRLLAEDFAAAENVPPYRRSPYDGYALRSEDTAAASKENPVTFPVIGEILPGIIPDLFLNPGTAVKVLTGAYVPESADAVVMYEKTDFSRDSVTLYAPLKSGENIIEAGEDIKAGTLLAALGTPVDCGLAASLGAQGLLNPRVFRKPIASLISTGSELSDDATVSSGKIRNTNRYSLGAALERDGCIVNYMGIVKDNIDAIASAIRQALENSDIVLLTGGVSAGDYDLTPGAMEAAGCSLLVKGVAMKPGMACCYGKAGEKLVCALSGNPASSLTNYQAVVHPAVRKLAGWRDYRHTMFPVILSGAFPKKSKDTRFLRGRLDLKDGRTYLSIPKEQGNVVISSAIGCNVLALVHAGSGPVSEGTVLEGFLI